jgi:Amt family ammonium transporter
VLQVLGVFILWVGWYGFNGGSTLAVFALDTQYARDLGRVVVCTTISAATGAFTVVVISKYVDHVWDVGAVCNGVLAGLVSITAGCVVVETWAAVVIGIVGGCVYVGAAKLERLLKIDDPLDAWPVHGACGVWGVLAVGVFCRPEYSYNQEGRHGFIYAAYAQGTTPSLLGPQIAFLLAHTAWVGTVATVLFGLLRLAGLLRVSAEVEEMGLDLSKHGGEAYYDVVKKPRATADDVVIISAKADADVGDAEAGKGARATAAPMAIASSAARPRAKTTS